MLATLTVVLPLVIFSVAFAVLSWATVTCFTKLQARRKLRTPQQFELLPQPGDRLRDEMEVQFEKIMNLLVFGSLAAGFILVVPLIAAPASASTPVHPWVHWVVGSVLFLCVSIPVVWKSVMLLNLRSKYRLGYQGERFVAEQLQPLGAHGYLIYHDVPAPFGGNENLDHLVVGPHGLAVIETKTRSKPTHERYAGLVVVTFDGERLIWPEFHNDTKPLEQVARCAEKVRRFVQEACAITAPVHQVVAIPGWSVKDKACISPRVVNASGVSDAVLERGKHTPDVLTKSEIRKIGDQIELLCRSAA
jgi:hypothetical protein